MAETYKGYDLNQQGDSAPWGTKENTLFKQIIDKVEATEDEGIHNNLQGLQGGSATERVHLTLQQRDDTLSAISDSHSHTNKSVLDLVEEAYTTAEKTKLTNIEEYAEANVGEEFTTAEKTKLSNIEDEANKYVLPSDVVQDADYVHTDNNYTDVEKDKLEDIQAGAEVNVNSDWDATSGNTEILNRIPVESSANDGFTFQFEGNPKIVLDTTNSGTEVNANIVTEGDDNHLYITNGVTWGGADSPWIELNPDGVEIQHKLGNEFLKLTDTTVSLQASSFNGGSGLNFSPDTSAQLFSDSQPITISSSNADIKLIGVQELLPNTSIVDIENGDPKQILTKEYGLYTFPTITDVDQYNDIQDQKIQVNSDNISALAYADMTLVSANADESLVGHTTPANGLVWEFIIEDPSEDTDILDATEPSTIILKDGARKYTTGATLVVTNTASQVSYLKIQAFASADDSAMGEPATIDIPKNAVAIDRPISDTIKTGVDNFSYYYKVWSEDDSTQITINSVVVEMRSGGGAVSSSATLSDVLSNGSDGEANPIENVSHVEINATDAVVGERSFDIFKWLNGIVGGTKECFMSFRDSILYALDATVENIVCATLVIGTKTVNYGKLYVGSESELGGISANITKPAGDGFQFTSNLTSSACIGLYIESGTGGDFGDTTYVYNDGTTSWILFSGDINTAKYWFVHDSILDGTSAFTQATYRSNAPYATPNNDGNTHSYTGLNGNGLGYQGSFASVADSGVALGVEGFISTEVGSYSDDVDVDTILSNDSNILNVEAVGTWLDITDQFIALQNVTFDVSNSVHYNQVTGLVMGMLRPTTTQANVAQICTVNTNYKPINSGVAESMFKLSDGSAQGYFIANNTLTTYNTALPADTYRLVVNYSTK